MVTNDQQLKMLNIFLPQKHLPSRCNTVKRRPLLMESPERRIKHSKYTPFLRITRTKGHCLKRSAQRHKNISFKVSFNISSFLNSVTPARLIILFGTFHLHSMNPSLTICFSCSLPGFDLESFNA